MVEISQNFVAFSEYMNFTKHRDEHANFVGTKNRTELILAHEKLGSQGI